MSKRLASLILAYGVLGALFAPAGLVAQDEAPAPPPAEQPRQQATTTETQPAPAPAPAPAPPPPAQEQPKQAAAAPPPEPQPEPEPAPIAVASGPGSVTMKNIAFSPSTVSINEGDSVTWTNADEAGHNATASDGSFRTANIKRGASASHTFAKAGTFAYECTLHPGMSGTVKVQAASSGGGGGGGSSSGGDQSTGSGSSAGSTTAAPGSGAGSTASLPATGVDAGGLALWGAGFLLLGLFARRRTT